MAAKKSRKFGEKLDSVARDARLNSHAYALSGDELQWAILAQLVDLNFEVRELREEIRAARDGK